MSRSRGSGWRRVVVGALVVAWGTALVSACDRGAPPSAPGGSAAASGSASTSSATIGAAAGATSVDAANADATATATATATAAATGDAGSAGDATLAGADATPSLYEADGAPLGQTDAFPSVESPSYRARVELLWRAIVEDAPETARPAFFPLVAYEQVKAIPKPAIDYEKRLIAAFVRDVHAYHQKLGADAATARFVSLDVPVEKAKWMVPGSEGNKLGYDRVLDAKLTWADAAGKQHALPVKSMISWRGEWYVVHLAGFK